MQLVQVTERGWRRTRALLTNPRMAAERDRRYNNAEKERMRRCELREEWMGKGLVVDARMHARWKAQEEVLCPRP